jgi:hypothetical protein
MHWCRKMLNRGLSRAGLAEAQRRRWRAFRAARDTAVGPLVSGSSLTNWSLKNAALRLYAASRRSSRARGRLKVRQCSLAPRKTFLAARVLLCDEPLYT